MYSHYRNMFPRKYVLVFALLVLCVFAYIHASGDEDEKAKKGPKVTDKVRAPSAFV